MTQAEKTGAEGGVDEHEEVRRAAAAIHEDVKRFVSGEDHVREPLLEDTSRLVEHLVAHFADEEKQGGLGSPMIHGPHVSAPHPVPSS